jgi:hypothetical protein
MNRRHPLEGSPPAVIAAYIKLRMEGAKLYYMSLIEFKEPQ